MGGVREGEMSAGFAVLGLLIEQPDDVRGLEERLAECFPLARFVPTTANNAVRRLEGQGFVQELVRPPAALSGVSTDPARAAYLKVRRALREGHAGVGVPVGYGGRAPRGRRPASRRFFEATSGGMSLFRRWMGSASPLPAMREELRAKMAFAQPEDLPRLIEVIREEIRACEREYQAVHATARAIEDFRAQRGAAPEAEDWSLLMGLGAIHDDAEFWLGLRQRLERRCEYLEELREEASRRVNADRRRR
jgi:hypothetical protein